MQKAESSPAGRSCCDGVKTFVLNFELGQNCRPTTIIVTETKGPIMLLNLASKNTWIMLFGSLQQPPLGASNRLGLALFHNNDAGGSDELDRKIVSIAFQFI